MEHRNSDISVPGWKTTFSGSLTLYFGAQFWDLLASKLPLT